MNIIQKVYKYFLKKVYKQIRVLLIKKYGIGRPKTKDKWNEEYSKGKWDYLLSHRIDEKNKLITDMIFAKSENAEAISDSVSICSMIESESIFTLSLVKGSSVFKVLSKS